MNILTFDVEEWFHLLDFESTRSEEQWANYEVRIHQNMERIFSLLEETNTKATFFIIGWIAKTYPEIVKKIAEKYEVASHTMTHQVVWQQSPKEFRQDVEASIKSLEDIIGKKVRAFRAPGYSIRESEGWAFEILHELGITIDCSVFPARHAHGGMASYPYSGPSILQYNSVSLKELPISVKSLAGKHLAFSGGGYFRLFPYSIIKRWSREIPDYLLSYIHPRDLDADQPILKGLPFTRRFKSYVGLKGAEKKLKRYLNDFDFVDIDTADKMIDWDKVPIVRL